MSKFVRGDARLAEMLGDHETRAEVDAIVEEMQQIDRAYKMGRSGDDAGQGSPAPL